MTQLSTLRRPRPSTDQLDLFSSMFGTEPIAPVIVPELPPIIAEPLVSEPEAAPAIADTAEQTTIVECDPFIIDLPEPVKPSRDFRITADHRICAGTMSEKARDNIAAIRALKASPIRYRSRAA